MLNVFTNCNESKNQIDSIQATSQASAWDKRVFDDAHDHKSSYIKLDGEYDFFVKSLDKAYFNGSTAIPACPMANLVLSVQHPQGSVDVKTNIKICDLLASVEKSFFMSINMRDESTGKYCKDWDNVVGRKGRALFGQSKPFTTRGGKEITVNEVKKYLVQDKTNATEDQKPTIGVGSDRHY